VYVVTKLGLLFVYDLETATAVYRNRISPDPIFLAANSDSTGGIMAINRWGGCLRERQSVLHPQQRLPHHSMPTCRHPVGADC
jgi:hypothetical protein